jgi:hypothetical protein
MRAKRPNGWSNTGEGTLRQVGNSKNQAGRAHFMPKNPVKTGRGNMLPM